MRIASLSVFALLLAQLSAFSAEDAVWVATRVAELQPKPEEKRFDEIGWAKEIREAERLARENHRAVFLFTHDGRMNIGRC